MKEWSKAIKACNEFAEEVGLTEKDVEQAINEVRNDKRYTLDKTQFGIFDNKKKEYVCKIDTNRIFDKRRINELITLANQSENNKANKQTSKVKYWLIYADWEGRKAKPFGDLGVMERWIKRNSYITVIAKTQVVEDEQVTVDKDKMLEKLTNALHSKSDKELIEEYEKIGCKVKYTPGTKGEVIFKD